MKKIFSFFAHTLTFLSIVSCGVEGQKSVPNASVTPKIQKFKIPTKIEAEDFHGAKDLTSGNRGAKECTNSQNPDVDLDKSRDQGGTCYLGWTKEGESVDYIVNTGQKGPRAFDINLRMASLHRSAYVVVETPPGTYRGRLSASADGYTLGWQSWVDRTIKNVPIQSGDQVVRLVFHGENNINYIEMLGSDAPVARPETSVPVKEGIAWRKANLTYYTSYPDEGSDECIHFNGCTWAGLFAAMPGQQSKEWVKKTNIAAVHSKDFGKYKLKTLMIRQGSKEIKAKVYDMCADSDCNGCCSINSKDTGFLIDIEEHTKQRFGSGDGVVEWTCIDCD